MRNINRLIGSLLVTAALAAPVAMLAAPAARDANIQVRFYDRNHKDYHNWDDRENHAWGVYLNEHHKKEHEFKKASRREQSNYWNWRHSHPDHD